MKYTDEYIKDLMRIREVIPKIENLKDKTILITGANGLICSAVVDFLVQLNRSQNYQINIICAARNRQKIVERFAGYLEKDEIKYVYYNAEEAFQTDYTVDYVIHGASNANPKYYVEQPVETMIGNIMGIKGMLELLKKQQKGRLLYISSSEVYGNKDKSDAFLEKDYGFVDILSPRSCYPSSKRAAETLCASYKSEYGVDFVVARPGHVYGSSVSQEDNRIASQFLKDAKQGKNLVMKSDGRQKRSYCYVLDCVSAIISILLKGESGEAYNISNKNSIVTIAGLSEVIAKSGGVELIRKLPSDSDKSRFNPMDNSSLKSDKLEKLGWRALFDIEEGVNKALESL